MRNPNRHVQIFISIAVLMLLLLSTGCKVVPESKEAAQPKKVAAAHVAAPKSAVDPAVPVADVACNPGEKQVSLYTRANYKGKCEVLGVGKYGDLGELQEVGGKKVLSIRVGQGASVTLYPKTSFSGQPELLKGNDEDLRDNKVGALKAGSLKVAAVAAAPKNSIIKLPAAIDVNTDLVIKWSITAGVKSSALLTGPGNYSNKLEKQAADSWAVGKLPSGEYKLVLKVFNQAGAAEFKRTFEVASAPEEVRTHMEPLPQISESTAILLKWVVDSGAENIERFHLEYRKGNAGDWQDWTGALLAEDRELLFWGTMEKKYAFRIRAINRDGTKEPTTEVIEASTIVIAGCSADEFDSTGKGDDYRSNAPLLKLGEPQTRNWCPAGDVDWLSFKARKGDRLKLTASPAGLASGAVMQVYDHNRTTLLSEASPEDADSDTVLTWKVPSNGTFYVKLSPLHPELGGVTTNYDFLVERGSVVGLWPVLIGLVLAAAILTGLFLVLKRLRKTAVNTEKIDEGVTSAKIWLNKRLFKARMMFSFSPFVVHKRR